MTKTAINSFQLAEPCKAAVESLFRLLRHSFDNILCFSRSCLLRTMPAELDDIELRSVQLQQSHSRDSISNACDLRRVPTDKGEILVAIQGDVSKPAILTLHDLGLNCKTQHNQKAFVFCWLKLSNYNYVAISDASTFTGFFNYPTMRALLENFCVYHVTAPGQEEGAPTFPEE